MGYFTRIADKSFTTSSEGERLFLYNGPWSRPYVIPDRATEERLHKKVQLLWKLMLVPIFGMMAGILIFVLAITILASISTGTKHDRASPYEDVSRLVNTTQETVIYKDPSGDIEFPKPAEDSEAGRDGLYSLMGLAVLAGIVAGLQRLLFRNELKQMRRLPTRIRIKDFYRPLAKRKSYPLLLFVLLMFGSMALLQTFEWMRRLWLQGIELETFLALIYLAILWLVTIDVGYQIFLKVSDRRQGSGPRGASHGEA